MELGCFIAGLTLGSRGSVADKVRTLGQFSLHVCIAKAPGHRRGRWFRDEACAHTIFLITCLCICNGQVITLVEPVRDFVGCYFFVSVG